MNTIINQNVFNKFPNLQSERLIFREFKIDDAKDLFDIRSSKKTMEFMDTDLHNDISESEIFINSIRDSFVNKTGINWAIIEKASNKFIGYFGFWRMIPENCRAEIGYALKPEFWGKRLMKEAMEIFIPFGFKNIKLHSIEANVNPNNEASIKLLENLKFKKEAYFRENFLFDGNFYDSLIFSLLETDVKQK